MTKYVFIDGDHDKWELQNGRWVSTSYPSIKPKSTAELYNEYGGSPYIEVESWDDIPVLPDEPTEIGTVYETPNNGVWVRYSSSARKPWIGTVSEMIYAWEDIVHD